MRTLASPLIALGALLATATPAADGVMSAGDLQQLCKGTDTTSRNVCRVYILGVVQGIEVGLHLADSKTTRRPCIPQSTSAEGLEQAVRSKLDEDLAAAATNRDQDASSLIVTAAAQAFPCPKPGH
jgi:hypothetical protein